MKEKRRVMETSEERQRGWIKLMEASILPMENIEVDEQLKDIFKPKFAILNEQLEFIDIKRQIDLKLNVDDENFNWHEVYKIESICNRLEIIEEVIKIETIGTWGLCVYLYLTCFDSLGQKEKRIEFDNWINKIDLDEILITSKISSILTFQEKIRIIYREWNKIFGVKNCFYNFLQSIEYSSEFKELLECIEPVGTIEDKQDLMEFKISSLFYFRNNFTHNTKNHSWPAKGEDFELSTTTVYKSKTYDVRFNVSGLINPLKKCVLFGLMQSIKQNILDT